MQADFAAMTQSVVDGAPEIAAALAKKALADGIAPLQAIDQGFVPGMAQVGEQFAQRKMASSVRYRGNGQGLGCRAHQDTAGAATEL